MTEFLTADRYLEFLGRIDIAIFNHRRQQGMGNIITLLGLGKKVYLRKDTTSGSALTNMGILTYVTDCFDLQPLRNDQANMNAKRVKEIFSTAALESQWKELLL
jgi:hypothetical protein